MVQSDVYCSKTHINSNITIAVDVVVGMSALSSSSSSLSSSSSSSSSSPRPTHRTNLFHLFVALLHSRLSQAPVHHCLSERSLYNEECTLYRPRVKYIIVAANFSRTRPQHSIGNFRLSFRLWILKKKQKSISKLTKNDFGEKLIFAIHSMGSLHRLWIPFLMSWIPFDSLDGFDGSPYRLHWSLYRF